MNQLPWHTSEIVPLSSIVLRGVENKHTNTSILIAYAADYRLVRIIDLGLTIYRPLLKLKPTCSVDCLGAWAVFNTWPRFVGYLEHSRAIGIRPLFPIFCCLDMRLILPL